VKRLKGVKGGKNVVVLLVWKVGHATVKYALIPSKRKGMVQMHEKVERCKR
jgi:hypothetical protein